MKRQSKAFRLLSLLLTGVMILSTLHVTPIFAADETEADPASSDISEEVLPDADEETADSEVTGQAEEGEQVVELSPGELRAWLKEHTGAYTVLVKGAAFYTGADSSLEIPAGLQLTLTGADAYRREGYQRPLFVVKAGATLTLEGIRVYDLSDTDAPLIQTEVQDTVIVGEEASLEVTAQNVTGYYTSFAGAVKGTPENEWVKLLSDASLEETIQVEKLLTVDLNGHTLNASCTAFEVQSGLTLQSGAAGRLVAGGDKKPAIKVVTGGKLNVLNNTTVTGEKGHGIYVENGSLYVASGAVVESTSGNLAYASGIVAVATAGGESYVDVSGTVYGRSAAISGNASAANTGVCHFNIWDGAIAVSELTDGLFLPNRNDITTVRNAAISGPTGIEIRGGVLDISGSDTRIQGTNEPFGTNPYVPVNNGNSVLGAGIAVSRHIQNAPVTVTVQNATVEGRYAVYETNLVNTSPDSEINIHLLSGIYNGDVEAVKSTEAAENILVTGGVYSTSVKGYFPEEYREIEQENESYLVTRSIVAQIGGTTYPTLARAIAAAQPGDTVELLEDVQECITIEADDELTLNLHGHTVTNVDGAKKHTVVVEAGGRLVLDGNGTVDNISHQASAIYNEGFVQINNGTLNRSKEAGASGSEHGGNSYYTLVNHGEMIIGDGVNDHDDVQVLQSGFYSSLIQNGVGNKLGSADTTISKLTIQGGRFDHGKITVKNEAYGNVIINDGSFFGDAWALCNYGEAEINGGTFEVPTSGAIYNAFDTSESELPRKNKLTVAGGHFTYDNAASRRCIYDYSSENTLITGGVYSSPYIYYDFTAKKNIINNDVNYFVLPITHGRFAQEEGTYIIRPVTEADAVAKIGDTLYVTLAGALAAAQSGDEVELLKDAVVRTNEQLSESITLNLNGHTVQMTENKTFTVTGDSTVTITGNGAINAQANEPMFKVTQGKLVIENGTYTMQAGAHRFGEDDARTNCRIVLVEAGQEALIEAGAFISDAASNDGVLTATGEGARLTMVSGSIQATESCLLSNGITTGPSGIVISKGASVVLGEEAGKTGPTVDVFASAVGMNNLQATSELTIYGGSYTTHNTYQTGDVVGAEKFNSLLYLSAAGRTDIHGGTFRSLNPTESAHIISLPYQNVDHILNIDGGDFTSAGDVFYLGHENGQGSSQPVVSVTGGIYSDDVEEDEVCAENYGTYQLPDSRYLVRVQDAITIIWTDGLSNTLKAEYLFRSTDELQETDYPQAPARDGFRFTGWAQPEETEAGVYAINAQWQQLPLPVSVVWMDGYTGTTLKTMTGVTADRPVTEADYPQAPLRDGYTFDGWARTEDTDGNVTFTATWAENQAPVVPENPTNPVNPNNPANPTTPTTPTTPEAPTAPVEPVTPAAPEAPAGTTTPEAPAAPTTPVTPAAPQPGTGTTTPTQEIEENDTPLASTPEKIEEEDTPLAPAPEEAGSEETWSLLNLLLMLVGALAGVLVLIRMLVKKKGAAYLLGIIPAVIGIIAFLLTQSFSGQMALVDKWTWLMAVVTVLQGAITAAAYMTKSNRNNE